MRAVCLRCGATKASHDVICGACGHSPHGDALLVAWLLSDAHLTPAELDEAALRVRRGAAPRPSKRMLDRARRELGRHADADPGLSQRDRLGLIALGVLVTPAVGLAMAWTWRTRRPRSASQALWLSLPTSLAFTVAFAQLAWFT